VSVGHAIHFIGALKINPHRSIAFILAPRADWPLATTLNKTNAFARQLAIATNAIAG